MTHVSRWTVRMAMFEEGDATTVRAVLETGANTLAGVGRAMRNPHDPSVPEIGVELAAGRALMDLGRQLVTTAAGDIEAVTGEHATGIH